MYIKRFSFALFPAAHYSSTTNANMPDALVPGYVKSWTPKSDNLVSIGSYRVWLSRIGEAFLTHHPEEAIYTNKNTYYILSIYKLHDTRQHADFCAHIKLM